MLCSTARVFLGKHPLLSLNAWLTAGDMGQMSLSDDELREEMSSIPGPFWLLCCCISWQVTPDICMVSNPAGGQQWLQGTEGIGFPGQMGLAASLYLWGQGMKQASDLLSSVKD